MARATRDNRRATRGKFPPECARALSLDELPRGGGGVGAGGSVALELWQLPKQKVCRGVVVCGQVKQRLCTVIPDACRI
jgi:hypothetical protein